MSGKKGIIKLENFKGDLLCIVFNELLVESDKGLVVI